MGWLFNTSDFISRSHCGSGWTTALKWINQVANGLTAVAFISIPITLYLLYRKRGRDIPAAETIMLFATFILACGIHHLHEIIVFYKPMYRWFTLWDLGLALVSVYTAVVLPIIIIKILWQLPSIPEFEAMNQKLAERTVELHHERRMIEERNRELRIRVDILKLELKNQGWISDQSKALDELTGLLQNVDR